MREVRAMLLKDDTDGKARHRPNRKALIHKFRTAEILGSQASQGTELLEPFIAFASCSYPGFPGLQQSRQEERYLSPR